MINSPESQGEALNSVSQNSEVCVLEKPQTFRNILSKTRRIVGRVGLAVALSSYAGAAGEITFEMFASNPAEAAAGCGEVLVAGGDWMGGQGVDVHSNGSQQTTGYSCKGEAEVYNLSATPAQYGFGWQCVELANRLYASKGWFSKLWLGSDTNYGAKYLYTYAANGKYPGLLAKANGSGYIPVPGDMIIHNSGTYGHVALVDRVDGGTLFAVEQNNNSTGRTSYSFDSKTGAASKSNTTISGYIHAEKNTNTSGGSNPTPTSSGKIPYAAITESQEFYSEEGWVYTRVGGSAWPIKHKNGWNSGDRYNWGGDPVGPVSTRETHDHEAGYSINGTRDYGAHPPVDGTTVHEEGTSQQWYFVKGHAYPIGVGELDDLGVRNKALRIPIGRLTDFEYGTLPLSNGSLYRYAGTPRVNQLIINPNAQDQAFHVNNETVLSCLELTQTKRTLIIPQAAAPYVGDGWGTTELSKPAACEFPPSMVLFGPGGLEQWRITGNNSGAAYRRHYFPNALTTYLHTSGNPDYRTLRSTQALNGVVEGTQMTMPNGQFFENTGNGDVFKVDNGVFKKVPWPDMLSCLGNPSIIKVPANVVGALPQGPQMTCSYENQIIVRPDGRAYYIEAAKARPIGNPAIRDCIKWFGAGGPTNVSNAVADSYTPGTQAPCPFQRDYGLKFIQEEGDPTVWFVENDGLLRHVGSLCVGDPYTTQWKQFRVWKVAPGVTHANAKGTDWWADGAKCDALPKVWMG